MFQCSSGAIGKSSDVSVDTILDGSDSLLIRKDKLLGERRLSRSEVHLPQLVFSCYGSFTASHCSITLHASFTVCYSRITAGYCISIVIQ
jgi:hypothetical protein